MYIQLHIHQAHQGQMSIQVTENLYLDAQQKYGFAMFDTRVIHKSLQ